MTMLSGFLNIPSIDGVYWSLFIEMQFYALVAIVLLLRKIHRIESLIILWLLITVLLDVVPIGKLRFIFITQYAPYFIGGAVSFLIYSKGLTLGRLLALFAAFSLSVWHSLDGVARFNHHYQTLLNEYVLVIIIGAFYLMLFLVSMKRTGIFMNKSWVILGALTYPLYLIHQYAGFMIFNSLYPAVNKHALLIWTLLLMVGFSYLVSQKVERVYSRRFKNLLDGFFDTLTLRVRRS